MTVHFVVFFWDRLILSPKLSAIPWRKKNKEHWLFSRVEEYLNTYLLPWSECHLEGAKQDPLRQNNRFNITYSACKFLKLELSVLLPGPLCENDVKRWNYRFSGISSSHFSSNPFNPTPFISLSTNGQLLYNFHQTSWHKHWHELRIC